MHAGGQKSNAIVMEGGMGEMVKMMVMVVFVFTLCWLPFNVLWVVQENIGDDAKPYLWFALHWLAMSHACYNPIIYCYMNSRYRAGFIRAFSVIPCCRWCLPPLSLLHQKNTNFPLTSLNTESTLVHRNNTCKTYISVKQKNGNSMTSCNPLSIRSLAQDATHNQQLPSSRRNTPYPAKISEQLLT